VLSFAACRADTDVAWSPVSLRQSRSPQDATKSPIVTPPANR
jgi:hypothetical protein